MSTRKQHLDQDGVIKIRRSDHGVTVSAVIPGHAGWIITRQTLPEALTVLADCLSQRTPTPGVGEA